MSIVKKNIKVSPDTVLPFMVLSSEKRYNKEEDTRNYLQKNNRKEKKIPFNKKQKQHFAPNAPVSDLWIVVSFLMEGKKTKTLTLYDIYVTNLVSSQFMLKKKI